MRMPKGSKDVGSGTGAGGPHRVPDARWYSFTRRNDAAFGLSVSVQRRGCMSRNLTSQSRPLMWLDDFRRDVAYGLRTLLRTPAFTAVAVLTLAVGISAVTVIYSVLRNVALDPFPYSRSDRLVNVVLRDGSGRIIRGPYFRAEEFLDYQEQTTAFEDVVATTQLSAHWMSDSGAERLGLNWMTPNGFDFLGVPPLIGRVFDHRDVAP